MSTFTPTPRHSLAVRVERWIANRLRTVADRIDQTSGPRRMTSVSGFTFEDGIGTVFRNDGRGCPVWYLEQDYHRAHDERGYLTVSKTWFPDTSDRPPAWPVA